MKKLLSVSLICLLMFVLCTGCSDTSKQSTTPTPGTSTPTTPVTGSDDDFPNKPIEIIVPYAPGASTDSAARIFASVVSKYLPNNQPVVVVNKAGSGGSLGVEEMLAKPKDGYTVCITTVNTPIILNPLTQKLSYTAKDVMPLMQILNMPSCVNIKADSQWKTPEDLLNYIRANPGAVKAGITGVGSAQQLYLSRIAEALDSEISYIPFTGVAEAQTALLQGMIDIAISTPTNYDPTQAVALFTVASDGVGLYPEIPKLKDHGVDVTSEFYTALFVPTGIPENRAKILEEAFKKAFEDPELIEKFQKAQYELAYKSGEEVSKMIEEDIKVSTPLLEKLGLLKK